MAPADFAGKYHRASEPTPGVLLLEFNRTPVNAFHDDMWTELRTIMHRVSNSPSVRCVVLSSTSDKYFTAGLDLTGQEAFAAVAHLDPARKALALRQHILDFQDAISSLSSCTQPVICALHGISFGLAIDIASACDVRLAASDTVLSIAEVNIGIAADIGSLQRLPKVSGNDSLARELALTGRRFGANEARQMGFVSTVVEGGRAEVVNRAVELAGEIASKSPVAVVGTKAVMNHARDHSVADGLEYVAAWNAAMVQTEDMSVAMKAALAKRKASFPSLRPAKTGPKAKL